MSVALRSLKVTIAKISAKTRWVFVEVARNDGAVGLGEATLNGSESGVLTAAAACAPRLWTIDATDPGAFAESAAPAGLAEAAMVSAIDLALWDLHAQESGARLVDAIGAARRQSVPVYANINRRTEVRTPEGFARSARDALAAGYSALKVAPFDEVSPAMCARGDASVAIDTGLARIAAVRDVAGTGCRLMVDCHWRFDEAAAARMIDAAAEHGVHWIECPLPETPENLEALSRLRERANAHGTLLAGMELGIGVEAFRPFCEAGAYDVMMPDVKYVGGLEEMLRCSELFADYGVAMSPHNPSGPAAHAASLHVSAAMQHLDMLELQFDESPLFGQLVANTLPLPSNGVSSIPAGTGLGIRLDAATVAAHVDSTPRIWTAQ